MSNESFPQPNNQQNGYDWLFDPNNNDFIPERVASVELDTRQKLVFAPFQVPQEKSLTDEEIGEQYDHLFDPQWEGAKTTRDAVVNNASKYGREPTEESKLHAVRKLINSSDPYISAIVSEADPSVTDVNQAVESINQNASTREALAGYFLGKLDKLPNLPNRVASDTQKKPKVPGYFNGYISSREYAVLLAMAMIDGSFKPAGLGDEIQKDQNGRVELGQHRAAAEMLLK